jgi:hypothetical protein
MRGKIHEMENENGIVFHFIELQRRKEKEERIKGAAKMPLLNELQYF